MESICSPTPAIRPAHEPDSRASVSTPSAFGRPSIHHWIHPAQIVASHLGRRTCSSVCDYVKVHQQTALKPPFQKILPVHEDGAPQPVNNQQPES